MNRRSWTLVPVAAAALLFAASAQAQAPAPPPGPGGPPPHSGRHGGKGRGFGDHIDLLGFGAGGPKTIKGAPFSAAAVSETTQTLGDGTNIHRTTQSSLFRDSSGRTRREMSFSGVGPLNAGGAGRSFVVIRDPGTGSGYYVDTNKKTARSFPVRAWGGQGKGDHGSARIDRLVASGQLTKESLGTQTIEGVLATGTRLTHVIPAGKIGNDKPISIVTESWVSNDLQEVVLVKRTDPRFGTSTYKLTNIQRTEPSATLFQLPADVTVSDTPPRPNNRRGGPPAPRTPPPGMEDEED